MRKLEPTARTDRLLRSQTGVSAHCPRSFRPPQKVVARGSGSAYPRTLPLFVAPIQGESLESWLEAIAARHEAPFGEIVRRCAIPAKALRAPWLIGHTSGNYRHVSAITGVNAAAVRAMTRHPQHQPTAELDYGQLQGRTSGWERRPSSRLCARCLASNGGRWMSHWRLNWSFACPIHHCLLTDLCPGCGGLQRQHAHPRRRVPSPGRCARIHPTATRGSSSTCATDLTTASPLSLERAPAIVRVQQQVAELLAGRPISLPIYQKSRPQPRQVLNDVKVLARWAVSRIQNEAILRHVPAEVAKQLPQHAFTSRTVQPYGYPSALAGAVGITCAFDLLALPSIDALARALRDLMTEILDNTTVAIPGRQVLTFAVRSAHDLAYTAVLEHAHR